MLLFLINKDSDINLWFRKSAVVSVFRLNVFWCVLKDKSLASRTLCSGLGLEHIGLRLEGLASKSLALITIMHNLHVS